MHVVLIEPEIPPNTGNIARTCAATHSTLHLVEPLGFSLEDRYLRRAGVDCWHLVDVRRHPSWQAFLDHMAQDPANGQFHFFTSHGGRLYTEASYQQDAVLVFGRESTGLPPEWLDRYREHLRQIPMTPGVRSLNLSNAVAVVVFEALRQLGFPGLHPR